jgi:hypothetical protein
LFPKSNRRALIRTFWKGIPQEKQEIWKHLKFLPNYHPRRMAVGTLLFDLIHVGGHALLSRELSFGADPDVRSGSQACLLWYAYISRQFKCLKRLLEHGADISALGDDPILSLPDIRIDNRNSASPETRKVSFTAYGPSKSWFHDIKYAVTAPVCVDGVWQAKIEMNLCDRQSIPDLGQIQLEDGLKNSFAVRLAGRYSPTFDFFQQDVQSNSDIYET